MSASIQTDMKIAIIMNDNSYVGREYVKALIEANICFDLINIGHFPKKNEMEEKRCGGLWNPPSLDEYKESIKRFDFESLKGDSFYSFLCSKKYDLGVQAGTGILNREVIDSFKYGILNFHPGDLPCYRGCSAPEWQILEGNDIVCTCHLIDEGIDTGKIYLKRKIYDSNVKDYHMMRAMLYPRIARFVVDVLKSIDSNFLLECKEQDDSFANYRKYVGDDVIDELIINMS